MQVGGGMGFLMVIFSLLVLLLPSIFLVTIAAGSHPPSSSPNAKQAYIVYISDQSPPKGQTPEDYYIKTLIPILGSETAAKDALLYSYTIVSGFVAKLTPHQASRLQRERGILYVIREYKMQCIYHIEILELRREAVP